MRIGIKLDAVAHTRYPLITLLKLEREITLTEWAPSPLNLPKRKNMGHLNFHMQTTCTKFQDPTSNGS